MPRFTSKRVVRHAAANMFDLVADVERYPEFVPLCRDLKVRERRSGADGVETIVARILPRVEELIVRARSARAS